MFKAKQLIPLAGFGVVNGPHASCMVVHIQFDVFEMTVGV